MSEELYTLSEYGDAEGQQAAGPLALDIKRLVSLRLPLMIAVCVVFAVPGAIVAWFTTPLVYTATAELRFLSTVPKIVEDGRGGNSPSYDKFVNTQIGLITGPEVISRAIDRLSVDEIPSLRESADPLATIRSAVRGYVRGRSELVTISCTLPERQDAHKVLETLLETYLEYARSEAMEMGSDRLKALIEERNVQQTELDLQASRILEQEQEVGLMTYGSDSTTAVKIRQFRDQVLSFEEKVSRMEGVRRERLANLNEVKALLERHQEDPDAAISERDVESRVSADPDVSAYRSLLFRAEDALAMAKERFKPTHPNYDEAQQMVDARRREMERFKREARERVLMNMVQEAEFMLEQADEDAEDTNARLASYKAELETLETEMEREMAVKSRQRSELNEMKQKANDIRATLTMLSRQIDDIQREEKAPARIIKSSDARVSRTPNYKKHFMKVIAALMASACLGVGAGVARELSDTQLRSSKDLTRLTKLPVIASIPHADEDEFLQAANVPLLTMDHPSSMAADEYRRILSRILYPPEETTEVNSLLIASACSGDGKTSLACNLAIALSQAHRQVLVVDLSSQQPAIEACFGLSASMGLAELLRQDAAAEQCLQPTEYEGLLVMGPGLGTQDLASRLASRRMTDFLEWAEQEFDHVIIDSPPSLLMSDAKLLAPLTDGVIVVVGVGVSSTGMVKRCLQDMEQLKANVLGVVLNGIRRMRGGYLGDRRRLFYAYYQGMGNGHSDTKLPEMQILDDEEDLEPAVVLLPSDEDTERDGSGDTGGQRK